MQRSVSLDERYSAYQFEGIIWNSTLCIYSTVQYNIQGHMVEP